MDYLREFQGPNAGYIVELFERYQADPNSIEPEARRFFETWTPPANTQLPTQPPSTAGAELGKILGVANLAQAIRSFGHLQADLDPLGSPPPGDPSLDLGTHGLTEADLRNLPPMLVGGDCATHAGNALEAIEALREVYTRRLGFDFGHIVDPEERGWLRQAAESHRFRPADDPQAHLDLLRILTKVDTFERFLQRAFPGKTRFSIEGVDLLVPILSEIIRAAGVDGVCTALLGMAHRGRLNVLAQILRKPYAQILAEFKDPGHFSQMEGLGWTGDVKYHKGACTEVDEEGEIEIVICMPPNPSHLEFIDPVMEGMARAADTATDQPGAPRFFPKAALPILIHGDASFPGQGVVAETLNLSQVPGFNTGGTLHIITNNQLGFTATPLESRSSLYASDFARGLKIPVVHVNADDPVAGLEAALMAYAYRARFGKDFLVDLIGYRRYGHNEGDEPSFTQPQMYAIIDKHPRVRELWARRLVEAGALTAEEAQRMDDEQMAEIQRVFDSLEPEKALQEDFPEEPPPGAARKVATGVPLERLRELNQSLLALPGEFHLNPKLDRPRKRRAQALDDPEKATVDWATAEDLAIASLLAEGVPVRITGQDVERGTFSQRHAVLYDAENGQEYVPLQTLPQAKAAFEIHNSPLIESAVVGFEFGYNIQAPERLVIWEAQYGDFANVAQAMLDEFVLSARSKWGQAPSLVMLLPHGNEGQGPDHSSARPERFLQLAAENTLRLVYPTTAAQYFHLLRRQAALLKTDPLPLVVLSPKGLLRHPLAASRPSELEEGSWQAVLVDPVGDPGVIRRLILLSGRLYVDLAGSKLRNTAGDLVIARLEQLYPFPFEELEAMLGRFPNLGEVIWAQEEPANMGGWEFGRDLLAQILPKGVKLWCVSRPASSSPAEGSSAWYAANQRELVEAVFRGKAGEQKPEGEEQASYRGVTG